MLPFKNIQTTLLAAIVLTVVAITPNATAQPVTTGKLAAILDEVSGITLSRTPGIFAWVHNDSGDTSRVFGIDKTGAIVTTLYFKGRFKETGVKDCEDITSGWGNDSSRYIYLGDIGDNGARRSDIQIYRIPEPVKASQTLFNSDVSVLTLRYPDGPRDAETLMLDPVDRLIYIISKREDSISVYSTSLSWQNGDSLTLAKKTRIFLPGMRPLKWVVSGDISGDGNHIVLKTLQKIYYWNRQPGEAVWQCLQRQPAELPYQQEPQGEAICFDESASGYFTVSEGKQSPVYYYRLPSR